MKCGSKNILKLQYGSKNIIAAYWGSKIIWESVPDTSEQDINIILESIINGTELDNIDLLLLNIKSSNKKYTNINDQLTEIILTGYIPLANPENYLTFEAYSNDMRISFTNNCQYSLGANEWFDLEPNTFTPAVKKGQKIYFKATGLTPNYLNGIGTFIIAGYCNLSGNCNSMLFGDDAETNLSLSGKNYAFYKLFSGASAIINASLLKLPATTLSNSCYSNMFYGCTSLINTPTLPSVNLIDKCYQGMFSNCVSLTTAPNLPATTLSSYCYDSMFENCISLTNILEFSAKKASSYCCLKMFSGCTSLTTVPKLSMTTLNEYCCSQMFKNCTSLINAPELPAIILYRECYSNMFEGCKSLVTAPNLPATTLARSCYYEMFKNCSKLIQAPNLPATTLIRSCYYGMFYNCKSLVSAPALPATTLDDYCYGDMFYNCSSLVSAPELPATTLTAYCYEYMFSGCESLVTAPTIPATKLAERCCQYMFRSCTSLVTASSILPATTLADRCYSNMFQGCSSLVVAPELPATTLVSNCYYYMFNNCSKLNYIKALFTTTPSSTYTSNWVSGVSSTGTFVKNIEANWDVTGAHGIPSGWTVTYNFTPEKCTSLLITADDVSCRAINTTIYWTAQIEGKDDYGNTKTVTVTGEDISESFPQNTSTTDTVERTISYTYMGVTATTTITQNIWVNNSYTIDLNNQWQSSTMINPDSSLYDGVYESFSNKGISNTAATMYIDIEGYKDFDLYIRSYAEGSWDYVMISQLDQTIDNNTSYSNTTLVKAHTRGNQKSGTSIDNYTKVSFTGIDEGQHRITIVYRKDGSGNSGDDRGYILIPKDQ